jgi:hypothetical protein
MQLACIVLAHRGPEQLALLLSVLRHPQVRVYLHLDRRVPLEPLSRALADAGIRDAVLLPRRATRWGGADLVDAALDGLSRGVADGCDYFCLLSGQDFPLRPIDEIVAFAEEAGDCSYMEHWPIPTSRWRFEGRDRTDFYTYNVLGRRETCVPRGEDLSSLSWKGRLLNELLRMRGVLKPHRRFPPYLRPFGGSQWWNLSRAASDHVLSFVDDHPGYRRYHEHTLAPDEFFFQSILLGTDFVSRHEIVNDHLRFMVWRKGASHPATLRTDDLPAMVKGHQLFARKFDTEVDGEVLARLQERITT